MSFGEGASTDYQTARGRDWPSVRQFNVFLANRLGALMDVVRRFESTDVRIVSLTVVESADCAIIRMVLSDPERAWRSSSRPSCRSRKAIFSWSNCRTARNRSSKYARRCSSAEISIHYAYPLLIGVGPEGSAALAIHVDDHEMAVNVLQSMNFTIFTESDLNS